MPISVASLAERSRIERLQHSISVYNENRRDLRQLYEARSARPWLFPTSEVYLVLRAGTVLPSEEHTAIVRRYLELAPLEDDRREQDMSRVVLVGMFCEQPPLGLLLTLERAPAAGSSTTTSYWGCAGWADDVPED